MPCVSSDLHFALDERHERNVTGGQQGQGGEGQYDAHFVVFLLLFGSNLLTRAALGKPSLITGKERLH